MAAKTVVIGVGNLLLKDEGVGVHVVQELRRRALPPAVRVLDGGVAGIGLLDLFGDARKLILADAAQMGLEAGAVARFTPGDVRFQSGELKLSSHDLRLPEVLELARALGRCPEEVVFFGIQPKEISWGTELTPEVAAVVPRVADRILEEIDRRSGEG